MANKTTFTNTQRNTGSGDDHVTSVLGQAAELLDPIPHNVIPWCRLPPLAMVQVQAGPSVEEKKDKFLQSFVSIQMRGQILPPGPVGTTWSHVSACVVVLVLNNIL